jgi:hypothetical protein
LKKGKKKILDLAIQSGAMSNDKNGRTLLEELQGLKPGACGNLNVAVETATHKASELGAAKCAAPRLRVEPRHNKAVSSHRTP